MAGTRTEPDRHWRGAGDVVCVSRFLSSLAKAEKTMPGQFFKSSVSPLKTISEVLLKLPRGLEAELRERVKGFVCWFRKRKVAQRLKEEVSHYTYSLLLLTGCILIYLLFPRDWASCATLFGALLTVYVAFYAIAWAKYEFEVTRQSHQMSVLAALCSTEKRKEFAPALAEMTRKKLPRHPTLFTPGIIFASLCEASHYQRYPPEKNWDTIDMVATILQGFDDWKDARFYGINLYKTDLGAINLSGANMADAFLEDVDLHNADLSKAYLDGACLRSADLTGINLRGAYLRGACLDKVYLGRATLDGADLSKVDLGTFYMGDYFIPSVRIDDAVTDTEIITQCVECLSQAKHLYKAKLPAPVKNILLRDHPQLFEKPEDYEDLDDPK